MATEPKHDVFICFRGRDCRDEFLPNLVKSLKGAGIVPFLDEDTEKGVGITPQLLAAIEESWSSIIVMSKRFATSTHCLGELEVILKKNKTSGYPVMPIFYRVDPSHVKKQKKEFKRAFTKHKKEESGNQVNRWKDALAEFGNLVGWVFPSPNYR
ncbi:hypothetical protein RJ640_002264 [Escallonia rubra]|uniref:ADP-ribosyl cyclase/cyclic ADP-ribose hydrolase n=1 Tax=Escallonia rubra TaxID=112253 RepID=A0AA88QZM3_9ASTE|nr:hypothetical protein RJ640_002264 [Escallonia rubra]